MDSIHLRIRIDRAIAEKALKMAQARGMELPDVVRMMIAKAVRIGDFSIEQERSQHQADEAARPYFAYDERQWNSMKAVLDAELALALVNQYIASHTLQIEAALNEAGSDMPDIERLKSEREKACKILATLDPSDADAVRTILQQYGPAPRAQPQGTEERDEGRDEGQAA